ncbi:MAG: DUF4173 domain-containing protein [Ardenticatenales bacterium]|nr:DUF4173 domain-containing protein [Ardenticatenales bacterium]
MNDTRSLTVGIAADPTPDLAPPPPMTTTTKLGLGTLGAALLLGLLGDGLLRAFPWGINLPLWVALLIAALFLLAQWQRVPLTGGGRWLALPILFFSGAIAWRASPALTFFSVLALLLSLGLAASRTRAGRIAISGIAEYAMLLVSAGINGILGALFLLFGTIQWKTLPRQRWSGPVMAIGRGLAISLPLLLLFGGLFAAADAVFDGIVRDLFDWDIDKIFSHFFLFAFWSWLVGGFLHQTLLSTFELPTGIERPRFLSLGLIEVSMVLGALNVLFLAFVLVQFRYFFGGAILVEATLGLTYAEYARRGFFELVTVATLLLPLLLLLHWLLRRGEDRQPALFNALSGALILMMFVIMVSAVQRMRLYQTEFGMTELRLYTTAFMGWLAVVFVWFVATVLRGRRASFASGALGAGFATLALLLAMNPDAFIVRNNVARQQAPQPFDRGYVTTLSGDAVPALIETLPQMKPEDSCLIASYLLVGWSAPEEKDWRTWNWARSQAWAAVEANRPALEEMACPGRGDSDF